MSWGWNTDGSLGLKRSENDENPAGVFCDPTLVDFLPLNLDIKQISAGARHSGFVADDNTLWFSGSNKHGQIIQSDSSILLEKKTKIFCSSWFTFLLEINEKEIH